MKIKMFHEVSRANRVPFYLQVKEQLLGVIINDFEVGDKIDNELDLCIIFGVSRPTVRQAIKELENEGFLTRLKGFGTFVKRRKIKTSLIQDVLMIDRYECFFYMRSILFDKKNNPIGFYEDFFSSEKSEFTFYTKR